MEDTILLSMSVWEGHNQCGISSVYGWKHDLGRRESCNHVTTNRKPSWLLNFWIKSSLGIFTIWTAGPWIRLKFSFPVQCTASRVPDSVLLSSLIRSVRICCVRNCSNRAPIFVLLLLSSAYVSDERDWSVVKNFENQIWCYNASKTRNFSQSLSAEYGLYTCRNHFQSVVNRRAERGRRRLGAEYWTVKRSGRDRHLRGCLPSFSIYSVVEHFSYSISWQFFHRQTNMSNTGV